ncbi:hypothetical protein RF11_07690 [Thelohanellus kitauei]|uniref:Uncharacterized protein n=1 Tax=Thelohanellus kitauei TaxID=669202 RepID=A0A0C2JDL1_THEKT|nr:hypothetical protein RF11_07690 [Thelohanellus kitauei]
MYVSKKRKVHNEGRIFKNDLIYKYFLQMSTRLHCHYVKKHADFSSTLSTEERPNRAKTLDIKLVKQPDFFRKHKIFQIAATRASFMVAYNIAKHSNSLRDGEFVKWPILGVVYQVSQEHRKKFEEISLSTRNIARRVATIDEDLKSQL